MTASPAARRLIAAFPSRSWVVPHVPHVHSRTFKGIVSASRPQAEHSFVLGNHRSTAISSRLYQDALYSSMLRSSPGDPVIFASVSRPSA